MNILYESKIINELNRLEFIKENFTLGKIK